MGINFFHKLMLVAQVKSVVIWVLRRINIPMIILDEFTDLKKVIRIKMVAFYAKMPFHRLGKELHFVGIGLHDFGLRKFLILHRDSFELVSRLIQFQNFSQLTSDSTLKFFLNLFLQPINAHFYSQVFVLRVLSPKPTFLLN